MLTGCNERRILHPIFYDLNENGTLEEGEPFYRNASVTIEPGNLISYGNLINGGNIFREFGDYSVAYNVPDFPNWELTTEEIYNITLSPSTAPDTLFFGLKPINIFSNIQPSISTQNLRCNESQILNIYAENLSLIHI